jgi:hypothetical protein
LIYNDKCRQVNSNERLVNAWQSGRGVPANQRQVQETVNTGNDVDFTIYLRRFNGDYGAPEYSERAAQGRPHRPA